MKRYESIVNSDVLQHFQDPRGKSLMNHVYNSYNIDAALAIAGLFCPEVVEVNDYIFISEFYNGGIDDLEQQFKYDRKKIEMFVNSWSLADLILNDSSIHNDKLVDELGKVIKYFWELRFQRLFPERNIVVEIGDKIMGERGLTVTVYQA